MQTKCILYQTQIENRPLSFFFSEIERASPSVQTLLFSATYDQTVMEFANKIVKNAVSVT